MQSRFLIFIFTLAVSTSVYSNSSSEDKTKSEKSMTVNMHALTETGIGESLGVVTLKKGEYGLILEPSLEGLSPGMHGFHVHENPSCEPSEKDGDVTPGGAAGSHYDPEDSGHHGAPWGDGHAGDLPALYVDQEGTATTPVLSPRLKMEEVKGLSLIIHAGGDNHSDEPKPLGGGGARIACGVVAE